MRKKSQLQLENTSKSLELCELTFALCNNDEDATRLIRDFTDDNLRAILLNLVFIGLNDYTFGVDTTAKMDNN